MPKSNFSEWYNEILEIAQVIDKRYNVKGCYVWMPFGFQIRRLVFDKLRTLLNETGHQETLFPELIPEDQLLKESEHVKGFEDEVYWVTHGGLTKLDVKLALRPTSETIIYPMFKLWVRNHADLPLKVYQIVNTFRYETKHTRPLIRDREISTFKEAHCVHANLDDAEKEMKIIQEVYSKFWDALAVPVMVVKRPEWDKFPGADYTISFDTVMPDGKTLQIATSHNLGTKFSKTFDITYEKEDGEHEYPYITCHGISGRAIAAMIAHHGDENGLVLPPEFAPIQIVIVPIVFKESKEEVMKKAEEIKEMLSGYRVVLDDRELTPGNKYYYWETKGVPIRIEIGPRDIENNQVVLVRRDTKEKRVVPLAEMREAVRSLMNEIYEYIKQKAEKEQLEKIEIVESIEHAKQLENKPVVLKARLCSEACAKQMENQLAFEFRGILVDEPADGLCIVCKKEAKHWGIFSKAY